MKASEKMGRFGTMEPLGREDFVREVTEGSKMSLNGDSLDEKEEEDEFVDAKTRGRLKGTGVVVFLFKDSYVPVFSPPLVSSHRFNLESLYHNTSTPFSLDSQLPTFPPNSYLFQQDYVSQTTPIKTSRLSLSIAMGRFRGMLLRAQV